MIRQRNMRWHIQGVSPYVTPSKKPQKKRQDTEKTDICLQCDKPACPKGQCEKFRRR